MKPLWNPHRFMSSILDSLIIGAHQQWRATTFAINAKKPTTKIARTDTSKIGVGKWNPKQWLAVDDCPELMGRPVRNDMPERDRARVVVASYVSGQTLGPARAKF